jgi:membrane-associated phospholipid phosphatase
VLAQRTPGAPAGGSTAVVQPELKLRRELVLTGLAAGMLVTGHLLSVDTRPVPVQGLDPAEIGWSRDRNTVGNRSVSAGTASDWTRNSALAFPAIVVWVTGRPGNRLGGFKTRATEYFETLLVSQGPTVLGKSIWSRPRPYAYLPEAQRPDNALYDVTTSHAFSSMPSGHSSSAWTGASLAMTEELLSRPDASWVERVGVGFVGGGLAGATAALRVEAGQHFPSDVLAGAGVGIATGIAVPLLHRGDRPMPSTKAWLETWGGALAGTVVGVLLSN